MQLNNLKSKIRRSLGRGGLNISVAATVSEVELLAVLCDRAESPAKTDGKKAVKNPSNLRNPQLKVEKPALSQNLFMRNKPNLNNSEFTANPCDMGGYNDLQTKPKNGANPNKPNQSQFQSLWSSMPSVAKK